MSHRHNPGNSSGQNLLFPIGMGELHIHHSQLGLLNIFSVLHGENNIHDNGHDAGGGHGIGEDKPQDSGKLSYGSRVGGQTQAQGKGDAKYQDIALTEASLGDHLDAVDENHAEHRDNGAAQDGSGNGGKMAPSLGQKPLIIRTKAPTATHHLLTTLVIETMPAF